MKLLKRKGISLGIGVLFILSSGAVLNSTQGDCILYNLQWFADHTNLVEEQSPDHYLLLDNLLIDNGYTLIINAGEYLYIPVTKKITIYGNLQINGGTENPVIISSSNENGSDIANIEWYYYSSNTFQITELQMELLNIQFTNENGWILYYEYQYSTLDDPPVQIGSSWSVTDEHFDKKYCLDSEYIFDIFTYPRIAPNIGAYIDTDSDTIPDHWENQNGFGYNYAPDALWDTDGDLLNNIGEYQSGSSPRVMDTDGDSLWDGREVHAILSGGFDSSPVKQHSDTDDIRDDTEIEAIPYTNDNYCTDPYAADTDGDLLSDYEEIYGSDASSPLLIDTDGDDFADNRDLQRTDINRKFAFICELTEDGRDGYYRGWDQEAWYVANTLCENNYVTYFISDYDYNTEDEDETNDIVEDEDMEFIPIDRITWEDFEDSWKDFWDIDSDDDWDDGDVGKPTGDNYGDDRVIIYLDIYGEPGNIPPSNDNIWVNFYDDDPNVWTGVKAIPQHDDEGDDGLDNCMGNIGSCIDLVWLDIPQGFIWADELTTNDCLNADEICVIGFSAENLNEAVAEWDTDNHEMRQPFYDFMESLNIEIDYTVEYLFDNLSDKHLNDIAITEGYDLYFI